MNETQLVYEQMRCKIAELEQENKVLAQNLEDTEIVNKALEKENAELKEKLGNYQKGMFDEIEKRNINLTKAKEIIKKTLHKAR